MPCAVDVFYVLIIFLTSNVHRCRSYRTFASSCSPAQPHGRTSRFLRGFGRNVWRLNDQILISGTNFATNVLTARAMADHQAEFGTFSVIYGVLLICNILQSTLITQAHNVLGSLRSGVDYRRYTASTAVQQLIIVLIEAVLVVPIVSYGYFRGWASEAMLIALIPSIVAWQLQEFVRRVLYTEGRYGAAFVNDIISYGGQTIVIVGMYAMHHYGGRPFTGAMALYALAATSAAAAVLGIWQLRGSVERPASISDIKENWHFGKWLTGGEMMSWMSSIHMQVWWAAMIIGAVASADLKAAQILYGPARVFTFFLGTILPIRFTRTLKAGGPAALHRSVRQICVIMLPLAGTYCLIMASFPKLLLTVLYGPEYAAGAANVLRLYSLCAFLGYMQMVITAALDRGPAHAADFRRQHRGLHRRRHPWTDMHLASGHQRRNHQHDHRNADCYRALRPNIQE